MSDLLTEFLSEARTLLEEASESLLALETSPDSEDHLNGLFRAMHTIKGGSGLFDMGPLTRVVHAAEDLLDAIREGEATLDSQKVDLIFKALDQVATWLDLVEGGGKLEGAAEEIGSGLADQLRSYIAQGEGHGEEEEDYPLEAAPAWLTKVPSQIFHENDAKLYAIEYTPDPECFINGDDPLLTARFTPGLKWLDVVFAEDVGDAVDFNPFRCSVSLRVISDSPVDILDDHYLFVRDECRFCSADPTEVSVSDDALKNAAIDLLKQQKTSLERSTDPALLVGRVESAQRAMIAIGQTMGLADLSGVKQLAGTEPEKMATGLRELCATAIKVLEAPPAPPKKIATRSGEESTADSPRAVSGDDGGGGAATGGASRRTTAIKVEQEDVDRLMKLVGELIVAKNALPFLVRRAEEEHANRRLAREIKIEYESMHRIVDEMQNAVMQIRMVPVGPVLNRYSRLIRDLGRKLDKKINLKVIGEETKADKNMVEQLSDPLVHLIRNSCDHGIEQPEERLEEGKPETATITLGASYVDDNVVIEVRDDGRGVNTKKVKEKAVSQGIITEAVAEAMPDDEAAKLILHPGFSTADEISDLSGRGVGMDVVHTMVRAVNGSLNVTTEPGQGTCVSISLPQSMAVSQVMMFDVDDGLFGLSIDNIVETVKVPPKSVHRLKQREQIVLRGRLIPLLRLRDTFARPCARDIEVDQDDLSILVTKIDDAEVGLVVDRVRAETDVMIEPLETTLNSRGIFKGSASLGDGSIMLVLNPREVIECH